MEPSEPTTVADVHGHIRRLEAQVALNRADIDSLIETADDVRVQAEVGASRADEAHMRIGALEARAGIDREVIEALRAESVITTEHAHDLEEALRSSRTIGAAVGIIMATLKVDEICAFETLARTSQNTNVKLRLIADELVHSGDLSRLVHAPGNPTAHETAGAGIGW